MTNTRGAMKPTNIAPNRNEMMQQTMRRLMQL